MQDVGGFKIELQCKIGLPSLISSLENSLIDSDWNRNGGLYKGNFISFEDEDMTEIPYYIMLYVTIEDSAKIPASGNILYEQVTLAKELKSVFENLDCNPKVSFFFDLPDGTTPTI